MGNRGCLVDHDEQLVRHHRGDLWIICAVAFGGRRVPLSAPGRYTPIFFLDDAVGLAAGHRPCGECRHADHVAYRTAVTTALGLDVPVPAGELNRRLRGERLRPGRGVDRAHDRITWAADGADLPDGTVIVVDGTPSLVIDAALRPFGHGGWGPSTRRPTGPVTVLTPPTSVAALSHGFVPTLHPSATPARPARRRT
jgi:hypothetical protein